MGGYIFLLRSSTLTFSRMSLIKPFTPCLYNPIQRYGQASKGHQHHEMEERAPSTAEEFKRMAEQKLKEAEQQGVASQVSDKANDGTEEATLGDANLENVKKRYTEHKPGADYGRRGDSDNDK